MDMVSTTGVEVMTEVVTEASVGEASLAFATLSLWQRLWSYPFGLEGTSLEWLPFWVGGKPKGSFSK